MTAYSNALLTPLLKEVAASNLRPAAQTLVRKMSVEVVQLTAELAQCKAELAKLKEQHLNATVNQPSGKKPEWAKGKDPATKPAKKKRRKSAASARARATVPRRIWCPISKCATS